MSISLYSIEECEKIAKEAALRYAGDKKPGITRKMGKQGFCYYDTRGQQITDPKELERINALAIPPAYTAVWICPYSNGHIQATGRDSKNRKQYRYHPFWQKIRQSQKFEMMLHFGKSLPLINKHIDEELNKAVPSEKTQVICSILYLLDSSCIRIGNPAYARDNQSYGLTTLRKKHLSLGQRKAVFDFLGKNAKPWHVALTDKKILRVLKKCEEIPGYELFKYYDQNHQVNVITSQDINAYLQALTKQPFTAKDFRTWCACREAMRHLMHDHEQYSADNLKKIIEAVAEHLGHTPAVCQKNYIAPILISSWETGELTQWLQKNKSLHQQEPDKVLLAFLQFVHKTSRKMISSR